MKILLLSSLLLVFGKCHPQVSTDQADVEEFFRQLPELKTDSTPGFYKRKFLLIDSIKNELIYALPYINKEKLFNAEDIRYFKAQLANDMPAKWNAALFDSVTIVSKEYLDSASKPRSFETLPNIKLSRPYFSKNKNYCVLFMSYYCSMICGEISLKLYKKVNGKWVFQKSYFQVVS